MKFENLSARPLLALILAALIAVSTAAEPVIGTASATGSFKINQSTVTGNGTLLEGAAIETSKAASTVQLTSGGVLRLGADSRGRIFRDKLVLERGAGRMTGSSGYQIRARSLQIVADSGETVGHVETKGANTVLVAALKGSLQVRTAGGTTIASVAAGRALEFEPQNGAAGPSTLTGCLVRKDGRLLLTDETAGITVELQGGEAHKHVGHRVEVTGSTIPSAKPAAGASQVIEVNQLKELSKRCSSPAGAIAGAGAGAGTATAGGSVATKAVVAGVIVAAATTGTAVAITTSDDPDPTISR
jgi:hypothetical protein